MALIVGAITLVNWSTRTEPLRRQFRTFISEATVNGSQTAAQIYESEGKPGLTKYLNRRSGARRIQSIGFFDKDKRRVAGNLDESKIESLFEAAANSDKPEFVLTPTTIYAANKVELEGGQVFIYAIELRRFRPPPFFYASLYPSATCSRPDRRTLFLPSRKIPDIPNIALKPGDARDCRRRF